MLYETKKYFVIFPFSSGIKELEISQAFGGGESFTVLHKNYIIASIVYHTTGWKTYFVTPEKFTIKDAEALAEFIENKM
jgi:hypothetical protein